MSTGEIGLATHHLGTGPAVLWLHGYTMNSTIWQPLWERLPGWHHIGVDLPGHGVSPPLAGGDLTLAGLATEIAAIARSEQASRVVALSLGTMIALQLAIDHPDAVRALVVAAPTIAGAPAEPGTDVRYRELHRIYCSAGAGRHMTESWMRSPPDIFRGIQAHPHASDTLREAINQHSWQELATGAMHSLTRTRQPTSALRTIQAAVLVLIGDADMPTFRDNAKLLGGAVPGCSTHIIAEAGHLCLLERPERAAPSIAEHLLRG